MKQLLVLMLLLSSISAWAQDVIVKKDGSTVVCRIVEVTATEVTYKKWNEQNGSNYVMDKSLVSSINYENGKKETFSEAKNLFKPNNQNDGVQQYNDKTLLKLDLEKNNPSKKVKRLRFLGCICGGMLAAGGIVCIAGGIITGDEYVAPYVGLGTGGLALGAGITTICLIKANKLKKELEVLQTSNIYRYDIPISNGSTFSVGTDLMNDRIMKKKTVGLGLSYNF